MFSKQSLISFFLCLVLGVGTSLWMFQTPKENRLSSKSEPQRQPKLTEVRPSTLREAQTQPLPSKAILVSDTDLRGQGSHRMKMIHGRIAYLRCEGLEQEGATLPCPRDRALESQVRQTLEQTLLGAGHVGCTLLQQKRGRGEISLEWSEGVLKAVHTREVPVSPELSDALDRDQLHACVGKVFSSIQTKLVSPRLVVAFRFELGP